MTCRTRPCRTASDPTPAPCDRRSARGALRRPRSTAWTAAPPSASCTPCRASHRADVLAARGRRRAPRERALSSPRMPSASSARCSSCSTSRRTSRTGRISPRCSCIGGRGGAASVPALMLAAEAAARADGQDAARARHGRDGDAARLYARLGWIRSARFPAMPCCRRGAVRYDVLLPAAGHLRGAARNRQRRPNAASPSRAKLNRARCLRGCQSPVRRICSVQPMEATMHDRTFWVAIGQ